MDVNYLKVVVRDAEKLHCMSEKINAGTSTTCLFLNMQTRVVSDCCL